MAQLQLRPHGVGDIIDASFTVYRRRFGSLIAVAASLCVIPFVVSLIGGCTLDEQGFATCDSAVGWIGHVATAIAQIVAGAAGILIAAEAYADRSSDWRRSAAAGLRRAVPIIAALIVVGVTVGIGIVLLVVPGVFLVVSFAVVLPALMIERVGPIASLRRSWNLVSGERWRLFGVGLVLIILVTIVMVIIGIIVGLILSRLIDGGDAGYSTQQLVSVLLGAPVSASIGAVLYLDLRVRKDDLDSAELSALLSRID